jgi:hypothetical protein
MREPSDKEDHMETDWHSCSPEQWDRFKACEQVLLSLEPELEVTITATETSHRLRLVHERDYVDLPIDVETYSALADLLVKQRKTEAAA